VGSEGKSGWNAIAMTVVAASDLVFASGPLFAILSYRANSSAVELLTLWDANGPSLRAVRTFMRCRTGNELVGLARERSGIEPVGEADDVVRKDTPSSTTPWQRIRVRQGVERDRFQSSRPLIIPCCPW